jgi:hypothetical protein
MEEERNGAKQEVIRYLRDDNKYMYNPATAPKIPEFEIDNIKLDSDITAIGNSTTGDI